jgi:hypothetical protein
MLKKFLLILSHKKSTFRDEQKKHLLNTNKDRFIFYYFIGDINLLEDYKVDEENKIVYLKVPDNYESLSLKTYYAMKFINENYLDEISGIFKTDDDIIIDVDKLANLIGDNQKYKYFGLVAKSNGYDSTYHFDKCESPEINKTVSYVPECEYCAGGGYYISKELINNIIDNISVFNDIIFEDCSVGVAMNKYGVYPKDLDVKSNGCMWGSPTVIPKAVMPQPVIMTCSCGMIKNKVRYNFCQKCSKLY